MAISGLSRVRTRTFSAAHSLHCLRIIQNNCTANRRAMATFAIFPSAPQHQMKVFAAPLRQAAHCHLRRLHQQEAQDRTALLGDVSQAPAIPTGLFQRHQPQITRHLLAAVKARSASPSISTNASAVNTPTPGCVLSRCAAGQFSTSSCSDGLRQFRNRRVETIQQLQQIAPPPARPTEPARTIPTAAVHARATTFSCSAILRSTPPLAVGS